MCAIEGETNPIGSISVIIPALNEARRLPELLAALAAQTYPPAEVIVVDGGSTDGTPEVVRNWAAAHPQLPVCLLPNPQRHIPHALNIGIAVARGEVIVRLDGHARPATDYLEQCLRVLRETGAEIVGGAWTIRPGASSLVAEAIARAVSSPLGAGDALYRLPGARAQVVDTVPFGCFRRELWRRMGGYNQALLTNEDYEFATRVRQGGGRVWFDPRLRCEYFARPTFAELVRQYWRYGWWKAQMLRRYPRSLRWRQAVPILWSALGPLLWLTSLWLPTLWLAIGLWAGYGTVLAISALQQTGFRRLRLSLLIAFAYLLIHFAWGWGVWVGWFSLRRTGE
ncbi:MAG: glycosyltransferase [Anaerolineales bacterium]|nr:glycosyltransferase [Anaerolineales bacterium]